MRIFINLILIIIPTSHTWALMSGTLLPLLDSAILDDNGEEPPSGIIIEEEGDHLNNAVRSVVPTIHDSNTLGVGGHNDYDHHDTRFNANSSSSSHSFFGWSEKQCRVTCYTSTKEDYEGNVMNAAMWSNHNNISRTCCICLNPTAIKEATCHQDCRYYLPFMEYQWQQEEFIRTCHRMCDEVKVALREGLLQEA